MNKFNHLNPEIHEAIHVLQQVFRFPAQLYCGSEEGGDACCFAHIVQKTPPAKWYAQCRRLEETLKGRLKQPSGKNMAPFEVIRQLQQGTDGSRRFTEEITWLRQHLDQVCQLAKSQLTSATLRTTDADFLDVVAVAQTYAEVHKGQRHFRPVQLATILLNVRASAAMSSVLIEMKTGEGKTDMCAAVAAVLAKRAPKHAVHILTSSSDRASDDCKSTKAFLEACTGRAPRLASEGLKWGDEGSGVVYAQVTDIQKMVVDEMRNGKKKELFQWLEDCFLLVDEADHVLIEQSENQLYISSPCRGFQALVPLTFLTLAYMDFDADFQEAFVKDPMAIPEKSTALASKLVEELRKFEGKGNHGRWQHMAPVKVDQEAFIASLAPGSLGARLKVAGKEFVIENQEQNGIIVPQVVIVDMATGTESVGTRWTSEAPAVEALHALPVGGSEPLAFFNSIPTLARKYRWVGGTTGTLGQNHCLEFYAKVYNARTTFRMPRNSPGCIFMLPPVISTTETEWLRNIQESAERYLSNEHGLGVSGPVLVITESILRAEQVVDYLKAAGYPIMKADSSNGELGWSYEKLNGRLRTGSQAHVFPFFKSDHAVTEKLPDASIVVASNKGGRGLDLKLDGKCPAGCSLAHPHAPATDGGSVLFVILTEALNERQDVQARGRCGRSGKPGVVQYQLFVEDTMPPMPVGHVVQVQNKKAKDESNHLRSKSLRVADMVKDGRLLEKFVDWKITYKRKLFNLLLPREGKFKLEGSFLPELEFKMNRFLEELLVERWAYWRTMGEPWRKTDDTVHHFQQRQVLGTVTKLDFGDGAGESKVRAFATRLWNLAAQLRLDAEQLMALALQLLPLQEHDTSFAWIARDLLRKAASTAGPWPLQDGEHWQAEWTGNAALLLARLQVGLGGHDAHQELQSSVCRLEHLASSLKLGDDKFHDLARRQGHAYPSVVLQQHKRVRKYETKYGVQRNEMLRQIRHRIRKLEQAQSQPEMLSLQHLSSLETSLQSRLYLLGYTWATTVFEFNIADGEPLAAMDEDTHTWLQDRSVSASK
ncbi:secA [Symbiodinium sp. CCMP2592]|nr:secA [Symbiodinium sp. CCMP2592]